VKSREAGRKPNWQLLRGWGGRIAGLKRALDRYLLMRPSIRGFFELIVLVGSGVLGYFFSVLRYPFSIPVLASGAALFTVGMVIHWMSHREHHQAHSTAEEVEKLATAGIYSKIRHPGYLGLILFYIGMALWFSSLLPVIVAAAFSALYVLTALREEEVMLSRFGEEYREYMRRVPWRFIPKVF